MSPSPQPHPILGLALIPWPRFSRRQHYVPPIAPLQRPIPLHAALGIDEPLLQPQQTDEQIRQVPNKVKEPHQRTHVLRQICARDIDEPLLFHDALQNTAVEVVVSWHAGAGVDSEDSLDEVRRTAGWRFAGVDVIIFMEDDVSARF